MPSARPKSARVQDGGVLEITWNDDRVLHFAAHELRAACPCALCVNRPEGEPPLRADQFPGIRLKTLKQVGAYAFQIGFDDGHALGLYSFDRLRELGHEPGQAPPVPAKPTTEFTV